MKKSNPLSQAIEARYSAPELARMVPLKISEVPQGTKVGDEVTVSITGKVDSINSRGDVSLKISAVQSDDAEEKDDGEEESSKTPKVLNVRTQESHIGGA
jgi:hypothetical protein